jgi:hypothetical protein
VLARSDRPVEEVIRAFAELGVEAGYLVPTRTGLDNSILDAHSQLRDYLQGEGLHDYGPQARGVDGKVVVAGWHVGAIDLVATQASLYRPESKGGDPRIWVAGLAKHAAAGNLLALLVHDGQLYVANTSMPGVLESACDPLSPLGKVLHAIAARKNDPAADLLGKLRGVAAKGFIPSLRPGPTGVGMTLETMLGIAANSSKSPDFRGIEIKASRVTASTGSQQRVTLFSKVPDWTDGAIPSAVALLQAHGYDRDGRRQLYCSMNDKPNTLGLYLSVGGGCLHALHGDVGSPSKVVQWGMDGLRAALSQKHHQTFWVKANARRTADGVEEFRYVSATHTRAPLASNLGSLLDMGRVEVDFVLHLMERGAGQKPRARDHGYLFKMAPRDMPLLFPPSVQYDLA